MSQTKYVTPREGGGEMSQAKPLAPAASSPAI